MHRPEDLGALAPEGRLIDIAEQILLARVGADSGALLQAAVDASRVLLLPAMQRRSARLVAGVVGGLASRTPTYHPPTSKARPARPPREPSRAAVGAATARMAKMARTAPTRGLEPARP